MRPFSSTDLAALWAEASMPLFWKPYQSEATQFIEGLKSAKPTLAQEQVAGRALLWDREQDRDAQADYKAARVAQKPYVYQTEPTPGR